MSSDALWGDEDTLTSAPPETPKGSGEPKYKKEDIADAKADPNSCASLAKEMNDAPTIDQQEAAAQTYVDNGCAKGPGITPRKSSPKNLGNPLGLEESDATKLHEMARAAWDVYKTAEESDVRTRAKRCYDEVRPLVDGKAEYDADKIGILVTKANELLGFVKQVTYPTGESPAVDPIEPCIKPVAEGGFKLPRITTAPKVLDKDISASVGPITAVVDGDNVVLVFDELGIQLTMKVQTIIPF